MQNRILVHLLRVIPIILNAVGQNGEAFLQKPRENSKNITLIWWTPFARSIEERRQCSEGTCLLTENRLRMDQKEEDIGVLFYGSDFDPSDLPSQQRLLTWWSLLHEESPKNQLLFSHEPVLELFNFTSTIKRESNEPLTLQYLKSIESLRNTRDFVKTDRKKSFFLNDVAPLVYIQSDCDTPSRRDDFVKELSKYIQVDSYGACLNNRMLPPELSDATATMQHPALRDIVSRYMFALSLENAACPDYITEKLWRPLSLGVVPVYWGASNVRQWIPNPNSVIDVRDFESPKKLAEFLTVLMNNDTLYESFLAHKLKGEISNNILVESMLKRPWGVDNEPDRPNFIEHFECSVCDAMHRHVRHPTNSVASIDHYGCPAPVSVLDSMSGKKVDRASPDHWLEEWHRAKLEAEKLRDLLLSRRYAPDSYHEEILEHLINKGHFRRFPPSVHEEL